MSWSRQITIWCDFCSEWEQYSSDVVTARREARAIGWKHKDGKDICPRCDISRRGLVR